MNIAPRWVAPVFVLLLAFVFGPLHRAGAQFALYGAQFRYNGAFYNVNPTTGTLTTVTSANNAFYAGLDAQPGTGILYAAEGSFLTIVDPATGLPTSTVALSGAGADDVYGLSFAPDGALYGLGSGNGNLYTVDPATGATTLLGTSDDDGIFGIEFSADGTLYGCGFDLYVLDPATGAILQDDGLLYSTPGGGDALFTDLDYAPNGVLYGVTGQITTDSLYRIDPATGVATLIGQTGGDLESIASVPEPRTGMLLALGGTVAFGVFVRRRLTRG